MSRRASAASPSRTAPYTAKPEGAKAESGDRVVISFTGTIDGEPFEGGTGEDVPVTIGSNTFIPGFEDQLVGIAAGETRTVNVTFPANYTSEKLAGKPAAFEVVAKSVEAPNAVTIDEAFAISLGLESLDKLTDAVKERIAQEYAGASRQKLKRALLDKLDVLHKFEAPPTLVEQEFTNVWNTVLADLKSQNRTFEEEETTEEKAREEYRGIADRRVRLGLVLAEIGDKNNIKVNDDEVSRALMERVRQYPGREREVWDYYQKNPNALAAVRAPIYEEKVVDFIVELADVTEKKVTKEELFKERRGRSAGELTPAVVGWSAERIRAGAPCRAKRVPGCRLTHPCDDRGEHLVDRATSAHICARRDLLAGLRRIYAAHGGLVPPVRPRRKRSDTCETR